MSVINEEGKISDIIVNEFDPRVGRKMFTAKGTITRGQIVKDGDDATEAAAIVAAGTGTKGIALADAEEDEQVPVLIKGPALVKNSGLTYGSGASDGQKATTRDLLLALDIRVETSCV